MRVVVTGATSMIGVALIKSCVENNCEVLAIVREGTSRLKRLPESDLIKLVYADLESLSMVQGDGKLYDVFYHFAWKYTARDMRDDPIAQGDNIQITLQAVELANKLGCKKFIGAGSQAEYGQVDGVVSADTRPNPITAYGIAKLSANMFSRRMCEQLGMNHIWGRIFSVYGCNDNESTMLNYAIDQFEQGKVAKFSSATQKWNYLNEEDAGEIFYLLGEKSVESGNYCVANNNSRVLREYIEELRQIIGKETMCEFVPVESRVKKIELDVDIKKTIDAIGYIPQITFAEGIKKMIQNRHWGG